MIGCSRAKLWNRIDIRNIDPNHTLGELGGERATVFWSAAGNRRGKAPAEQSNPQASPASFCATLNAGSDAAAPRANSQARALVALCTEILYCILYFKTVRRHQTTRSTLNF